MAKITVCSGCEQTKHCHEVFLSTRNPEYPSEAYETFMCIPCIRRLSERILHVKIGALEFHNLAVAAGVANP